MENIPIFQGDLQQLTIVANPEAAYEQCTAYITDCNEPLPSAAVNDDSRASYRGIDEDELLNREGLSPREYLEFTERERVVPPPEVVDQDYSEVETAANITYVSEPGEPGPRGPPGVRPCKIFHTNKIT